MHQRCDYTAPDRAKGMSGVPCTMSSAIVNQGAKPTFMVSPSCNGVSGKKTNEPASELHRRNAVERNMSTNRRDLLPERSNEIV